MLLQPNTSLPLRKKRLKKNDTKRQTDRKQDRRQTTDSPAGRHSSQLVALFSKRRYDSQVLPVQPSATSTGSCYVTAAAAFTQGIPFLRNKAPYPSEGRQKGYRHEIWNSKCEDSIILYKLNILLANRRTHGAGPDPQWDCRCIMFECDNRKEMQNGKET